MTITVLASLRSDRDRLRAGITDRLHFGIADRLRRNPQARKRVAAFSEYWPGDYVIVPPNYEQRADR